jgi:hypothetical protein
MMDPIGLGFENFDAIGRRRETENKALIDPSGELDGKPFANAWELEGLIASSPSFAPCLAANVYRYANGHVERDGEFDYLGALGRRFAEDGYRFQALLLDIASSKAFRSAGVNP